MALDAIFEDKHLKWIAAEWANSASDLAHWAMRRLVNRTDVWGQYSVRNTRFGSRISVVTLPVADLRSKKTDMVTLEKLDRHFKSKRAGHLIGLHCISPQETCRWFAVDLDVHDDQNPVVQSDANYNAARAWYWRLRDEYGLDPCLIASNGKGGIHLLCLLDGFYPLKSVYQFLSEVTKDYAAYGIERKPELFPSSEKLEHLGKWLRLPGRHHTFPHFSKVWSDESDFEDEEQWFEGKDAIDVLLNLRPSPLPAAVKSLPDVLVDLVEPKSARPVVCVDLDRTLAEFHEWRGVEFIGKPIEGAREFLYQLKEFADVLIYSSRCNPDRAETENAEILKLVIIEWLEDHKMPYTDVYTGRGKPLAHAFVDDRAVSCVPQSAANKAEVFAETVAAVKNLC